MRAISWGVMAPKGLKDAIRKAIAPLEAAILAGDYFSLQQSLGYVDRLKLLGKILRLRIQPSQTTQPEITFLLYSKACERLLVPLILHLLERSSTKAEDIQVNVIVLFGIHCLTLSPIHKQQLQAAGCQIQTDHFSFIRACRQPTHKLAVFCLDQRKPYAYHCWGVDTVDQLRKFGVKTLSIQHGGTRADIVAALASAASDIVLVFGKRVYREIVETHGGDPQRFRIVGNPLHDRFAKLDRFQVEQQFRKRYPAAGTQLEQKRIVLLATCLHSEYRGWTDEQQLYRNYIRHIYNSIDPSEVLLLVKMHPLDTLDPNLYRQEIPNEQIAESVIVIEPNVTEFDFYSLLILADVLITRASTVAEEALMIGKRVIAFDLFPEGPSKGNRHLMDYGAYQTAYQEPQQALRDILYQTLQQPPLDIENQAHIEAEITYQLDGNSAQRATTEMLTYLFSPALFTSSSRQSMPFSLE